jgi:pSer/pThr/pTyr-binding forkhead associated (FHA) protein
MPFQLTIAEGRGRGQRFSFETPDVTIGRGAENDVVLNDSGVSRNHARILQQGTQWVLLDNGSSNGTELNGVVLDQPAALRAGDKIGVGPVIFEFSASGEVSAIGRPLPTPSVETRITSLPKATDGATRVSPIPKAPQAPRAVAPRSGRAPRKGPVAAFARLPLGVRIGAVAAAALVVAAIARLAVSGKEAKGLACPETVTIDDDMASFSFGHGEVDVDCGSKVVFGFTAPPKTTVLFHYLPLRVQSPSELELRLNGKHLAWAPVTASRGETQVVSLPNELLSDDGRNYVAFTDSQKGRGWGVGRVRAEMLAITPGDLKAGREAYDRGRRKLEERRVAPRNLYDAWKMFTSARRQLEGLSPRPALYAEVAQLIKDCERDLDKECSRLLFTAARFEKYGQQEKAQQTFREVLLHFPGDEPSGCRKKAQGNIISGQVEDSE